MSSVLSSNPNSQDILRLLPKLKDDDPDLRFMALNDLQQILTISHHQFLVHDMPTCAKTVDGLLVTLVDSNGDVQNMAKRCLGPFVRRIPEPVLAPMLEKLSNLSTDTAVDQSIRALALREVVLFLPRPLPGVIRSKPVQEAYSALSRVLIPRLVGYTPVPTARRDQPKVPKGMIQTDLETGQDTNTIDVLTELASCFGPMLQEQEIQALQKICLEVVESDRSSSIMKKKAVTAISTLAHHFSDGQLSSFISRLIEQLRDVHLIRGKRKMYMNILGSLARSIPRKFGPYLKTLAPFVLSALSEQELEEDMEISDDEVDRDPEVDEVREAALIALEVFLSSCPYDMRPYTDECIEAAARFLKYDPNLAEDDDDADMSEDEDDALSDEDFEEEQGFDDDEDASWKVRRCAAKVFHTLISTRSNGDLLQDGTLYDRVAPFLVARFKEREESVRLEVVATLSCLVRLSGDHPTTPIKLTGESIQGSMGPPPSRKRRRGGSDASMFDIHATSSLSLGYASPAPEGKPLGGARASLDKLTPQIVRGVSQYLNTGTPATKQAAIVLLKDMVTTQHGGLQDYLDQIAGPVFDAAKSSGSQHSTTGASSTTANTLRAHALQLIGAIADTHSSTAVQPYLSRIVPALAQSAREKYSKLSIEALTAAEQVIKAITPPRATSSGAQNGPYIVQLYETLVDRISANDADLEVRQIAIHVLALLLGRTSGTHGLLDPSKRTAGLYLLAERLRNELTRLASVRAIDTIAAHTKASNELTPEWVSGVALELGAQFRKASRSLRGASLSALRTLSLNPISRQQLDDKTKSSLVCDLLPLLDSGDLHLLAPALVVLATFVKDNAKPVVTSNLVNSLCKVASGTITGSPMEALLALVRAIGEAGVGQPLMMSLLKEVGVAGHPEVVGKVIGNLLVYGGRSVGIKLDQFVTELNTATDDKRRCLALAILGEASLRLGSKSPIRPQLFMQYFSEKAEKVPLAAAVALGRAGAGNVDTYLPSILSAMGQPSSPQYLLLHSIKEILQLEDTEGQIMPYASSLWQNLVAASQAEDNKAIGAECIGRLAIIDPKTFLPQLQVSEFFLTWNAMYVC